MSRGQAEVEKNGSTDDDPSSESLDRLLEDLQERHDGIVDFEKSMDASLEQVHPDHQCSARNLLHYVAFRRDDVRDLQHQLAALGLSSLGRSEGCLLASLQQV